ncbi:dicarboxylate/amino acid:cation symporter [Rossellomorea marisflavi]|jgi:Na+/H+-dicarboxylate symporter|uniref:dicarboxylate/amino acid:cation symporter n=1 Tax=Rossellomorea marisflavi TaxID=189381 RepID=UPI0028532B82|nr:dicarboxylate/amino acid:cation symporter [Rossellomorea marisflavi]MDR4935462.1 dicarboxylate/amino acid:cation symporter [Rossellomorea marisflavi]
MKTLWTKYKSISLITKITVALILGVIAGVTFGERAASISILGDVLIHLLSFLIIPLILFTLMTGVNQTSIKELGKTGSKVFLYYLLSSAFAIIVGLTVASIFQPGTGMELDQSKSFDVPDDPGLKSVFLSIIPDNIIKAFTELNLLGIIFTAIVFGTAISYLRSTKEYGELGEHVFKVIEGLNEASLAIMKAILHYLPIGIFAIMAKTVGEQGAGTLLSLGNMIMVLYIALIVQLLLYTVAMIMVKINPLSFYSKARTPMITAFVTQSSTGTLPLSLQAARDMGIPKSLYGLSLPLGATINMDGAAIRIAVSAVFAANVVGDPLSLTDMALVVAVGTLASIGTAGVPGAGILMIATVFTQIGLPMEAVALLTAIDALVGMGCTAINITGDLAGTSIIHRLSGRKK